MYRLSMRNIVGAAKAPRPPNKDPQHKKPIDINTQFRCLGCNDICDLDLMSRVKSTLVGFDREGWVAVCPECDKYARQHIFSN